MCYLGAVHRGRRLVCPSVRTDTPPAALLALYGPPAWNTDKNIIVSAFLPTRIKCSICFDLNANCVEVCSHSFVPCVVHRCASVDVRCSGVGPVHDQQLRLQDLACLGCHMERGSAFLLQLDTHTQSQEAWQRESYRTSWLITR